MSSAPQCFLLSAVARYGVAPSPSVRLKTPLFSFSEETPRVCSLTSRRVFKSPKIRKELKNRNARLALGILSESTKNIHQIWVKYVNNLDSNTFFGIAF